MYRRTFVTAPMFLLLGGTAIAKEPNLVTERSKEIAAPTEMITPYIVDLQTWKSWTNWDTIRDPEATWTYDGNPGEVGHSMYWEGKKLGKGRLTITEITETNMTYDLWFGGKAGESKGTPSTGSLTVTGGEESSTVVWSSAMRLGFPGSLMKGAIGTMIGTDYAIGLEKLDKIAVVDAAKAKAEAEAEAEAEAARVAAEEAKKAAEEAKEAAEEAAEEAAPAE